MILSRSFNNLDCKLFNRAGLQLLEQNGTEQYPSFKSIALHTESSSRGDKTYKTHKILARFNKIGKLIQVLVDYLPD